MASCHLAEVLTPNARFELPVLLQRSEALQNGEEWEEVQASYEKYGTTFRQNPESAFAGLELVSLIKQEARVTGHHRHYYPEALRLIDQILMTDSLASDLKFRALTLKARILLAQHNFKEALAIANQVEKIHSGHPRIESVLVDCYVELGQYEQAKKITNELIQVQPNLETFAQLSKIREIHGNIDGAVEAMEMAATAGQPGQEKTAWIGVQLAEVLHRAGRDDAAKNVLLKVLEERPKYAFAKGTLAKINLTQGNLASAKTLLFEAIGIVPDLSFYFSLGELYQETKNEVAFTKTTEEIKVILAEDDKSDQNVDLAYAGLYFNLLGDPETALIYMRKVIKTRPENIDVNRKMALIYKALKKPIHLDYHLKRATRTNSQHPDLKLLSLNTKETLLQG